MMKNQLADALIIGGGPAGLAAAMALGRACYSVMVFDSQEYRNESVSMMHNVLCHDGEKPEVFRATAKEGIMNKYNSITFVDTKIKTARQVTQGEQKVFEVLNQHGAAWVGRKLILASGTRDILPSIPGYKELWGRGIAHCLFCDGFEKKGGHFGVLGLNNHHDLNIVLMSFRLADDGVTVYTNGKGMPEDTEEQQVFKIAASRGAKIDHRVIESFSEKPDRDGVRVHFQDGTEQDLKILLSTPPSVNRAADLISNLNLNTHTASGGHVISEDPMGKTNIRGCFVAGDTSTQAKIVNFAMASGSTAGVGAALELASDEALCLGRRAS